MNLKSVSFMMLAAGILLQSCGDEKMSKKEPQGIVVETQEVKEVVVPKIYEFSGTVSSLKKSTLSTRIMGQIDQIFVHEGDKVEKGQLLISVRSNDIMAQKSQVEANILATQAAFNNAKSDFDRITSLYESKSATQKELDDITTHYEMAKAQLEAAQKAKIQVEETLAYANIKAPYSGVITERFVDAGDMANPGMPLMAIEAPGMFEVITRIPESEVNLVSQNDVVSVVIKNTHEVIAGTVSHISPSSRFSGSQYEARIFLQPTDLQKESIKSGMFTQVRLEKGSEKKLLVANDLIVYRGQLTGVWTAGSAGSVLLKWVRLGKKYDDKTEVLSGIAVGDKLILKSQERLYDGLLLSMN